MKLSVSSSVSLSFVSTLKFLLILCCSRFEFCKSGTFVEPFIFKKCSWAELSANLCWNPASITFWEIKGCLWSLWEWQHQAAAGVSYSWVCCCLSSLRQLFCGLWICIKAEGMQTFAIPPQWADLLTGVRTAQPDLAALHKWVLAMRHFHPSDLYLSIAPYC